MMFSPDVSEATDEVRGRIRPKYYTTCTFIFPIAAVADKGET